MKLNLIADVKDRNLKDIIKNSASKSDYSWDVTIDVGDDDGSYVLTITDRARKAKKIISEGKKYKEVVYVGDSKDIEDYLNDVVDVWPSKENKKGRKARVERLLKNIGKRHDAYLYGTLLDTMMDSIPDLVWFKDLKGAHMAVNDSFTKVVGKSKEEIRGRGHYYIWDISPEDYENGEYICFESEVEALKSSGTCVFDEPLKTKDGMKQLKTYKTSLKDPFGKVFGTVGVAHDVTDFGNMGLELSILIDNIPFPLMFCSLDWKIVRMNAAAKKNIPVDEGVDFIEWKDHAVYPIGQREYRSKTHTAHQQFRAGDGPSARYIDITEQEIRDSFGNLTGYFVITRDCTIQKNYERMMIEAANTDVLTGLYNRRYFYEYVNNNRGRSMTLLYMDIDRFKNVNDSHGHQKGDDVLKQTAKIIRECFPKNVVARLGGDEFAVIIEGEVDDEIIKEKLSELDSEAALLAEDLDCDKITISVGVSKTSALKDIDAFIHEGDTSMYKVKEIHHREK